MKKYHNITFMSFVVFLVFYLILAHEQAEEKYYIKTAPIVNDIIFASYGSTSIDDLNILVDNKKKIDALVLNLNKIKTSSKTHDAENLIYKIIQSSYDLIDTKIDFTKNNTLSTHDIIFEKIDQLLKNYDLYNDNLKKFLK